MIYQVNGAKLKTPNGIECVQNTLGMIHNIALCNTRYANRLVLLGKHGKKTCAINESINAMHVQDESSVSTAIPNCDSPCTKLDCVYCGSDSRSPTNVLETVRNSIYINEKALNRWVSMEID